MCLLLNEPKPHATPTIPEGSADRATQIRAVIEVDGKNLNRELIDQGYGQYREHLGGAEAQEMFGTAGKTVGSIAEALAFQGDSSRLNPMRYIPTPGHTKAWQECTPGSVHDQRGRRHPHASVGTAHP